MAIQVSINDLSTWLSNQPANTVDTPYELEVTGITTDNIGYSDDKKTIGYILNQNKTKYVDLRETNIPSIFYFDNVFMNCVSLVYPPLILGRPGFMRGTFSKCTSLKEAPVIPDSVTNMNSTFKGCTSLVTAPVIPSSVDTVYEAFQSCKSLVNAPVIPNGVTSMNGTFASCTSLVNVPTIPNSVTDMAYAFTSCTSLVVAPVISNGVTNLTCTFSGCPSLVTVPIIPSSVNNITAIFANSTSLQEIRIMGLPSEINAKSGAFDGTPSTLKVYVPKAYLAEWKSITPSDWGLTSTDVFVSIPENKQWVRIA